ncbi:unnamed protein product [marine sediment metagenome]|uniref:Uncharacterized protein n=1 Tax=marine sediment metagenome TaxID=412755 RepID=X0RSD0_9ZZZZ
MTNICHLFDSSAGWEQRIGVLQLIDRMPHDRFCPTPAAIDRAAVTAMLAAWPITLDPIFSGLAWALIFDLFVSTVFTLVVIPVVYYMVYARHATL